MPQAAEPAPASEYGHGGGGDGGHGGGRAMLVFADDPALAARLSASAARSGGHVVARGALPDAPAALDALTGTAALVLGLADDGGAALDALLDRIGTEARAARFDALLVAPVRLIDIVGARADGREVDVLIDPSDAEIAAALATLAVSRGARVAEPGDEERRRLAELSAETARIARALASLSEGRDAYRVGPRRGSGAAPAAADPATLLAATQGMIRTRRMRDQFFDAALFADPVWDMLLDLFAARLERREVAVSSLCIAAAVPPTTALRWIAMMTRQGLIERTPDPGDGRRMFLALGARAAEAMAGYVAATLRHLVPPAA